MSKRTDRRRVFQRLAVVAIVVALALLGYVAATGDIGRRVYDPVPAPTQTSQPHNTDAILRQLFESKASDVQVQGQGTVDRLLADDNEGSRHQRFILRLKSGQTLLIAHNIDLAPRLNGLQEGDAVGFFGEYIYSDLGGTIHWTHHDPAQRHVAGWLEWKGMRYG